MTADLHIGIVRGLPFADYLADPAVSNTMLSAMAKSPAHCWALHLAPDRPQQAATAAMSAGTLAHAVILEPERVAQTYVCRPAGLKFSTREGAAWRDAQTLQIVDADDMATAEAQRAAVLRVGALRELLQAEGDSELSLFWVDDSTGLRCKARVDRLRAAGAGAGQRATALDIKTTRDLTPDAVQRAIATYGYHRQAAHYRAGLKACGVDVDEFVFGFVSGTYPLLAAAFVLDDGTRVQGEREVADLLARFAECQRAGDWPAFGGGYQISGLPAWALDTDEIEVTSD